jgi:hypothetical protein
MFDGESYVGRHLRKRCSFDRLLCFESVFPRRDRHSYKYLSDTEHIERFDGNIITHLDWIIGWPAAERSGSSFGVLVVEVKDMFLQR